MAEGNDPVSEFYLKYMGVDWQETVTADCPFCKDHGHHGGRLIVFLKQDSFFHGFFRCSNRCVPGGFPLWFARLAAVELTEVPDYNPDQQPVSLQPDYPVENINNDIRLFQDRITDDVYELFKQRGITRAVLQAMQVGFNGRYLVYPYFQEDGNCYAARCVYPEKLEDYFWQGNEDFSREPFNLYNSQDVGRCENGAVFICEGEENLLALKQLGFPGVAVSHYNGLEKLSAHLFDKVKTVFICVSNSQESTKGARNLASRIGYKARIIYWPSNAPNHYSLWQLAKDSGKSFGVKVGELVKKSSSFSPFASPEGEYKLFLRTLEQEQGEEYLKLSSGFPRLDTVLGGIHGINVIGGAPKVGKSTYTIQIGSEMALRKIPVLYYDFENGRQKIYQRTLSRIARLSTDRLGKGRLSEREQNSYEAACRSLHKMLFFWRVINDRKITPELMRKHIDFIRHETRSEYTVVVIDSLHKLPFNEFSERRTGIDAWLREMESIRDELKVSFLVISELSRGPNGSYGESPHLGVFKGSGDIEYSADNAMVLYPSTRANVEADENSPKAYTLGLVASREHSPGPIANYHQDFPYWGFTEHPVAKEE
jgi:replicative DNA helicase